MKYNYLLTSTKNMSLDNDLFKAYPDYTYLAKLTKLNRPVIRVINEGKLVGLLVLSKRNRAMKLCVLITHKLFKRQGIGSTLIDIALTIFKDDFNDTQTLYTVCPHQFNTDHYQNLLIKKGFQTTTVKANGDIVYTYAGTVQESN